MCRLLKMVPFEYRFFIDYVYNKGEILPKELIDLGDDEVKNAI